MCEGGKSRRLAEMLVRGPVDYAHMDERDSKRVEQWSARSYDGSKL